MRQRLSSNGREGRVIGEGSPYWANMRIVGGEETIPLRDGYFELQLPKMFFKDNPRSITLSWIDFYRG